MYPAVSLKKLFDGLMADVRYAAALRYFLTCLCLVVSVLSFFYAFWFGAGQTEISKWGLGIAGGFFASLTGFPINDIVAYSKAKRRYQLALDVLREYRNSSVPQKVANQLLELAK